MIEKMFKRNFNPLLTLYVNFKMFPFKIAYKLPIFVFGKWHLDCTKGSFVIESPIKRGMIYLGLNIAGYVTAGKSFLKMKSNSRIIFRGNCFISQGVQIYLDENATLDLYEDVCFGDNVKIICYKNITVGKRSEITWETQVMDYGSHFIGHLDNNTISNIYNPIKIGNYCWIGNRSTIMPGTILPDRIIVASNSLLNKNYIEKGIESYSLIGGMPAKLIAKGMKRIYSQENEKILKKYFTENGTDSVNTQILLESDND